MKVVFDFANKKIAIDGEGPELVDLFSLIRDISPKLPSITFTSTAGSNTGNGSGTAGDGGSSEVALAGSQPSAPNQTLRQFVRSLALTSLGEKVTAVAFYQAKTLGRPTFSPKDMGDWFTQCGLEKPSQMPVAVFDAKKRNGFLENAGHGSWKLATQGENMIIRKIEEAAEKHD